MMPPDPGSAASGPAALSFNQVTFAYPGRDAAALADVSLSVVPGAFATVVGGTGAGKSTLLRLAAPAVAPVGTLAGTVSVFGRPVTTLPDLGVRDVGLVLQDADAQIVCDDVRSEMAFGLESLGLPQAEMGKRIAETATFLGMVSWFDKGTSALSGGQRQVLSLAATLAMRPRLLLLDEPTAQLDPIAAAAFASLVGRANRELGITVVVATHAPSVFLPYVTHSFAIEAGVVAAVSAAADDGPRASATTCAPNPQPSVAPRCPNSQPPAAACPSDPRLPTAACHPERSEGSHPGTKRTSADSAPSSRAPALPSGAVALSLHDVWFRHARGSAWVFSGLDLAVHEGDLHVLLGGNGVGKTTLLRLAASALRPQRGRVRNRLADSVGYLPQGVRALIGADSVRDELMAWSRMAGYDEEDALRLATTLGLDATDELLAAHPLDLSGGQQRLLALAKVLLVRPRLLLLDEPTVGLDDLARSSVVRAVCEAARSGAAVLVATHDIALARDAATVVSLLFDGRVAASQAADAFFADAWLWGV